MELLPPSERTGGTIPYLVWLKDILAWGALEIVQVVQAAIDHVEGVQLGTAGSLSKWVGVGVLAIVIT